MQNRLCLLFTAILLFGFQDAFAAEFTKIPGKDGNPPTIIIKGVIKDGDYVQFNQLAINEQFAVVKPDSAGGNLVTALEIASTVRIKQFATEVTEKQCNSGCALIWIAGQPRRMGKDTAIGFHMSYVRKEDGTKVQDPIGVGMTGAYLASLGISDRAIYTLLDADPDDLYELTTRRADELGIYVSVVEDRTEAIKLHSSAVENIHKPDRASQMDAVGSYMDAAYRGFAGSQNNLGDLYEKGELVPKNDKFAVLWYTRAAERGEPTAYLSLANIFADSDDLYVATEALKFALLAQKELRGEKNRAKATALVAALSAKLSRELIQAATGMAKAWNPLYQEKRLMGDPP
jgi:hypothetical protein